MDAANNLADRTLVVSRIVAAPRALVFDAFTDPEHLARWWGPNGFTTTTSAFDMRPGGVWRFVMHGPDGRDYQNRVVFDEIAPPSHLVFHHTGGAEAEPEPLHHTTIVRFEDLDGQTRITLTVVFPTAEQLAWVVREHKADEGGHQTLGRLADVLDEDMFVISRSFAAPRETLWQMWSDPVHLARWWGPKGFDWTEGRMDFRPGGSFVYGMRGPKDMEMWGRFVFEEIVPPERMTYVSSFSDPQGGVTRAPFFTDWPLTVFNLLTLREEDGATRVTLRGAPLGATTGERARFKAMKSSMDQGFAGTFAQLDAYLATLEK